MKAQGDHASAARKPALDSTVAVIVATAAMSGCWLAAAARVSVASVAPQQLAKRPQRLVELSAEA